MNSKLNKSSGMINYLIGSEMIKGKNGKTIFNNKWRKFNEANECCWREVSRFCKENNIPFLIGFSGGKGIHISIFYGNIDLEDSFSTYYNSML